VEITPATLDQVTKSRDGKYIAVTADVGGVAHAIEQIDPHLHLRFSEAGEYYAVYWSEQGNEYLILTAQELDHRLVQKMEEVYWKCRQPGYDFGAELEANEDARKAKEEHDLLEERGPVYEQLAHAMRKDLGYDQGRIFVGDASAALGTG
jgi:hypothetical protein